MEPHAVPLSQRKRLVDRVDCPQRGGPGGQHDGADGVGAEQLLQRVEIHPPARIGGDLHPADAEQPAHPLMGVVGLLAEGDGGVRPQLARDEEGFQVGDGPARAEVAEEVGGVMEHRGDGGHRLPLQRGGRRPPVEGMIVWIDEHRHQICGSRRRMGRLQHLAGVARVEEGVVVPQPPAQLLQHLLRPLPGHGRGGVRGDGGPAGLPAPHRLDGLQAGGVEVHRRKSTGARQASPVEPRTRDAPA